MDRFKKKTDENGERTSLKIKISMRKTAKMIAVVSCTILMLAACSPKKEVISQSVTGNEDKTYDSGEWIVQKNGSLPHLENSIASFPRPDCRLHFV